MDSLTENHQEFMKNYRLILKSQPRLRSEKYNVFTKEVSKIAWSANSDKIIQLIDSTETYAYGKVKIKCINVIKLCEK